MVRSYIPSDSPCHLDMVGVLLVARILIIRMTICVHVYASTCVLLCTCPACRVGGTWGLLPLLRGVRLVSCMLVMALPTCTEGVNA